MIQERRTVDKVIYRNRRSRQSVGLMTSLTSHWMSFTLQIHSTTGRYRLTQSICHAYVRMRDATEQDRKRRRHYFGVAGIRRDKPQSFYNREAVSGSGSKSQ